MAGIRHSSLSSQPEGSNPNLKSAAAWNDYHVIDGDLLGVYDVRNYEPDGSDITAALRRARDAAVAAGGGRIYVPTGDWTVNGDASLESGGFNIVDLSYDNLWIEGDGRGSVIRVTHETDAGGFNAFNWWGGFDAPLTLSAPAAENDKVISVTDASSLSVGDYLLIQGGADSGYTWSTTQRVFALDGNDITLHGTLPFPIDDSGTDVFIAKISNMIKGGGARNLRFIQDGAFIETGGACAIGTFCTAYQVFENLWFEDWRGDELRGGGFRFEIGYQNRVLGVHFTNGGSGGHNDFWIISQSGLSADDIVLEASFEFGLGFAYCSDSNFGKITHSGHDNARPVKLSGCRRNVFSSIITGGSEGSGGLAVADSSCNNRFGQVILRGPGSVVGGGYGLWHSDQDNTGNTYVMVDSQGWLQADLAFFGSDTGNRVIHAVYSTIHNPGLAKIGYCLDSHAKASLPSGQAPATMIYVTDETGGAVPAFFDGTNWRRVTDRAIVS